jgi:hypothetical protein
MLTCDDGRVTAPVAAADAAIARPPADQFVCRLLRLPVEKPPARNRAARDAEVHKAFSASILVSAVRCLLTYLVLPFAAPLLGVAKGVGPWIGIPLGVVAIAFNVKSIRRFWAADHRLRWAYTAVGTTVIALLLVLLAGDVAELVG